MTMTMTMTTTTTTYYHRLHPAPGLYPKLGPDLPLFFKLHWRSVGFQKNNQNCCHHMSYLPL